MRGPGLIQSRACSPRPRRRSASRSRAASLPWLDLGVTLSWRHLRLEGESATLNLAGDELSRVTIGGRLQQGARHRGPARHLRPVQRPHRLPPRPRLPPGPRGLEGGAHASSTASRGRCHRAAHDRHRGAAAAGRGGRPAPLRHLALHGRGGLHLVRARDALAASTTPTPPPRRPSAWPTGSSRASASR